MPLELAENPSLQFSSGTQSCWTLCDPMDCSMPGLPVHHQLPELVWEVHQTQVHQVSDAIQPSHPLESPSPPAFNLSQQQGLFQWVSSLHQVAKYWSFSIGPSNEYSGLISFRMDWFDLVVVQGTLKSLLQHHSLKASISLGNPSFRAWESWRHSHAKLSRGRWGQLLTGRSYLSSSTAGNWCWGNVILQGPNEG